MSDDVIFGDQPEHLDQPPRRSKVPLIVGIVLFAVIVIVAIVSLAWPSGEATPAATTTASARASETPSAPPEQAQPAPADEPTKSGPRLLTADDLDDVLLTNADLGAAGIGLTLANTTDQWQASVTSANPPQCAAMIDTVTSPPADGFAALTAFDTGQGQLMQRVYLFKSAAAAKAALDHLKSIQGGCAEFTAIAANGDGNQTTEGFEAVADAGASALQWNRASSSKTLGFDDTGWQRTVQEQNVVMEIDYLAASPADGTQQAISGLFSAAQDKLTGVIDGTE